jgi:hypothetical protein
MTIAEIEAKYPNEWVLVNDVKKGRDGLAERGRVIAHDPNRDSVYSAAVAIPVPRDIAVFHTGPIPEDVLFIL